jgi:hypothetical protein
VAVEAFDSGLYSGDGGGSLWPAYRRRMMPKSALAASSPGLCYDRVMKEVVSPDVVKRFGIRSKSRTRKHIAAPLTADQISKRVGVTKKDAALVTKVLLELGYLRDEESATGKIKQVSLKKS